MKRMLIVLAAVCALVGVATLAMPGAVGAEDADNNGATQTRPVDYLIVTANGLHEQAREWADWRSEHGRVTRILTLADIGGEENPRPDINRIKGAIDRAARVDGKITEGFQVLLLGAVPNEGARTYDPDSEIPWQMTRMQDANQDPARRRTIPTDNFYADLVADDNAMPDIAVGRIPARTPEQAAIALQKVKDYETAPEGEWMQNLTFFAGEGRFGVAIDRLLENLFTQFVEQTVSPAYHVRMTYANINSSYAYAPSRFSDKVLEEANEGALMLVYLGHGLDDRLDNMYVEVEGRRLRYPILQMDDVSRFAIPDGKLPIMLILACRTGALDHADGCLSEAICFEPGAPIAVLSSSRDCHPYSNALIQKAFISEFSERRVPTLGEAMLNAKREMIQARDPDRRQLEFMASLVIPSKADRDALNRSHLAIYNLIGDPGLRVRYPSVSFTTRSAAVKNNDDDTFVEFTVGIDIDTLNPDFEWRVTIETRRSVVAGELKPFNQADLASGDEAKRRAAEDAIAANHAISNNKVVAEPDLQLFRVTNADERTRIRMTFRGILDRPLAPGDYILKLSALDAEGNRYGFTSTTLTVTEPRE
jgi:hypothetical protein